jgi:hypothetical protein
VQRKSIKHQIIVHPDLKEEHGNTSCGDDTSRGTSHLSSGLNES